MSTARPRHLDLRRFDESTLLRIALAYESAHDWRDRHPKLD